jgi:group I intron endonuclease
MNIIERDNILCSGIYEIINNINGKKYIGSALDLNKRSRVHKLKLQNGKHHASYLQRSWNKYGENSFSFNILLYCDKQSLITYEQIAIDYYKPEYNSSPTAGNSLGVKHTKQARKNMALAHLGNRNSVGNKGCVGRVLSEETKRKISTSNLGKKTWLGKKHTEETKKKISIANKGKPAHNKGTKYPQISEQKKEYWRNWRIERGLPPDQKYKRHKDNIN